MDARARNVHVDFRNMAHPVDERCVVLHYFAREPRRDGIQLHLLRRLVRVDEIVELGLGARERREEPVHGVEGLLKVLLIERGDDGVEIDGGTLVRVLHERGVMRARGGGEGG